MPEDSWNIHGWIALPLEAKAREVLGWSSEQIRNSFLFADDIENSTFVEVMFHLLRYKYGVNADFDEFAKEAQPLFGKSLSIEDRELASYLLAKFRKLIDAD